MGILDRVSTLLRANINDMIDRAEDPEKVVKQLIADMNNQLVQVKTQVAASIADEKQLYQRYQDNQAKATDWQQRAELAVEKGQDDMAREALLHLGRYRSRVRICWYYHSSIQCLLLKIGWRERGRKSRLPIGRHQRPVAGNDEPQRVLAQDAA